MGVFLCFCPLFSINCHIFIVNSSNIITNSEVLVDFHVITILQAGMHIYARAASRGKRVQVNTLIFFLLSLWVFLLLLDLFENFEFTIWLPN